MSEQVDDHDVYAPDFLAMLQSIWGDGFLSPGGADAVDAIVGDLDLSGKNVLDIGSGLGGPAFILASTHDAARVVGTEVQDQLVAGAQESAARLGIDDRIEFISVRPGPLPFENSTFDVVFSKDSIIHVADKDELISEIRRVLKPRGEVAIGDWFGGHEPLSTEAKAWLEATGLTFALKPIEDFAALFEEAGFTDIRTEDRNAWYAEQCKTDIAALKGDAGRRLAEVIGEDGAAEWLQRSTNRSVVVEQGHLRPGHVWARSPD